MTCDVHVHFPHASRSQVPAGAAPSRARASLAMRLVLRREVLARGRAAVDSGSALQYLADCMDQASTASFVVLALDAPRLEDGSEAPSRGYFARNDEVAGFCAAHRRSLFGASVHPYRPDACREVERLAGMGACLVKWLPSYQRIDPASPRCIPFYDALAHFGLPLLCHTGVEHFLPGGDQRFNEPARLALAIEHGVTVIAAHCGSRLMLHERCHFEQWSTMALEHEHFYGDLSAMVVPVRGAKLRRILEAPALLSKVVYGSDFPAPSWPWAAAPQVGLRRARQLARIDNPLERSAAALRSMGFPEEVFTRASALLGPRSTLSRPATQAPAPPLVARGA